ncbi:Rv3235 family protein [Streptomyces sp. NBC_01353]|uniref:Rv3235 family protein n=1 Tax=Streptomyces sp. NBC_01353 TaxID=2903835 RepID=UPI003DA3705A
MTTTPTTTPPPPSEPAPAAAPAATPTATTRPRTPRPRTAPRGPAGTGPRGSAGPRPGSRPGAPSRVRTPPRALPPHALFAERLLAVLSGERPVHWMLGMTVGEAYEQLVQLAPDTPFRSLGARPVLRTCRFHPPRTDAVEVCATVATGERIRAMAFRLERGADRRWRCAAVELDGLHARVEAQSPVPIEPRVPAQPRVPVQPRVPAQART